MNEKMPNLSVPRPTDLMADSARANALINWSRGIASPATWWSVLCIEIACLILPIFVIDYPPLMDLPNHLARLYILSTHDADPVLSRMWHSDWHIVPNLAIDLIGPSLINVTSVIFASRLILIAIILMFMGGSILLHRAIFGQRSYWPLLAGLLVYNAVFLLGFLNYLFGAGLALVGASTWIAQSAFLRRCRVPLSVLFSCLLFFCHIFALSFYLILIACWQLGEAVPEGLSFGSIRKHMLVVLPAGAFSAVLYLYSLRALARAGIFHSHWSSFKEKAAYLITPFLNYSSPLDRLTAVLFVSTLALIFLCGKLELPKGVGLFLAGFFLIFLLCPKAYASGTYIDFRLPVLLGVTAVAGSRPRHLAPGTQALIATVATIVFAVRLALIGWVWLSARHDLQDFRSLEAFFPQGSRIVALSVWPQEDRESYDRHQPGSREIAASFFYHLPGIWVIERQVFWPLLFANPTQQPIKVLPPYTGLAAVGEPPDYRELASGTPSVETLQRAPYLAGWQDHFDFVVVLSGGRAKHLELFNQLPLTLVRKADIAVLYKIQRPPVTTK